MKSNSTNPDLDHVDKNATGHVDDKTLIDVKTVSATNYPPKPPKPKRLNNRTIKNSNKIGRNTPCPCGSNKKYKKCCLLKIRKREEMQREEDIRKKYSNGSVSSES